MSFDAFGQLASSFYSVEPVCALDKLLLELGVFESNHILDVILKLAASLSFAVLDLSLEPELLFSELLLCLLPQSGSTGPLEALSSHAWRNF